MKSAVKTFVLLIVISIVNLACVNLNVPSEDEPDASDIYSDLDDVMIVANSSFRTIHNCLQEYESLAISLAVMADHLTMSWGTAGARDLSSEPRDELNDYYVNERYYSYYPFLYGQWKGSYQAISNTNSILKWLYEQSDEKINNESASLLEAFSLFVSGISHGYLGLVFDQAVVIRYNDDLNKIELRPWEQVIEASIQMLDNVIDIADSNFFHIPAEWTGGYEMTNIELSELANAYAARILMNSSRTKVQNIDIDWNRVLAYAEKGHDWDFAPVLGDRYVWYDFYWVYGRYPGWARVDMRIINLMDHDYPSRWPFENNSWTTPDGNDPGPADPDDARLETDFEYLALNNYPPDRGYYHFSHYRHNRYDSVGQDIWYGNGPKPSFLAWEVKLIEAEALLRTGNTSGALAILNDSSGPRKIRGQLPDVLPTDDVLRYILDEKEIECFLTGTDISYFDMRRTNRLQPTTLLHFPVPCTDLELMETEHYSIPFIADGVDGSAGNWTGWDE